MSHTEYCALICKFIMGWPSEPPITPYFTIGKRGDVLVHRAGATKAEVFRPWQDDAQAGEVAVALRKFTGRKKALWGSPHEVFVAAARAAKEALGNETATSKP